MAEKEDYYKTLGVEKTATLDQIKAAHKSIMLKNHPDMLKNKKYPDEATKQKALADADVKFKAANEAESVLSDPAKRAAYDKYGFKGVENMNAGKNASSGQSYEQVAGPVVRRSYSEEDTLSFFEKRSEQRQREGSSNDDGLTAEERRAKAAEERRARRGGGISTTTTPPVTNGSASTSFHDVAKKVNDVAETLSSGNVTVPLADLERFRDSLATFTQVIDREIAKAKKGPGFRP
ncbi:MAG TPA: DnaJ domain-containing protein [Patescibacteria group bacterium]|nr:DnaJ domain-containing protein [Patescibacteria group bacterium]